MDDLPKTTTLNKFISKDVTCVCFIKDYIEIHFSKLKLQFMAPPRVTVASETYSFPDRASFAEFINLIDTSLVKFDFSNGIFTFIFSNNTMVEVDRFGGPDGETFFVHDLLSSNSDSDDLF